MICSKLTEENQEKKKKTSVNKVFFFFAFYVACGKQNLSEKMTSHEPKLVNK